MMKLLTIAVGLAALGWSGYWVAGRVALTRGIEAGVAEARAEGWDLSWDDLSVAGFPNRFDTSVTAFLAGSPQGWGLAAPRLDVMALSYRPSEVIVVPATPLTLITPAGPVAIRAEDLRAFAAFTLAAPPVPSRGEVEATALTVDGAGLSATVGRGVAAMREAEPPLAYDLALSLGDLALGAAPGPVPIDRVEIDATATLDRPPGDAPNLAALTLRRAGIVWDGTRADLTGEIEIGPSGLPEGEVTVVMEDWRALLRLLTDLGLPPGPALLLSGGLAEVEEEGGRVEMPLTLSRGTLRFGGLPLAPLPRLPVPYSP